MARDEADRCLALIPEFLDEVMNAFFKKFSESEVKAAGGFTNSLKPHFGKVMAGIMGSFNERINDKDFGADSRGSQPGKGF